MRIASPNLFGETEKAGEFISPGSHHSEPNQHAKAPASAHDAEPEPDRRPPAQQVWDHLWESGFVVLVVEGKLRVNPRCGVERTLTEAEQSSVRQNLAEIVKIAVRYWKQQTAIDAFVQTSEGDRWLTWNIDKMGPAPRLVFRQEEGGGLRCGLAKR